MSFCFGPCVSSPSIFTHINTLGHSLAHTQRVSQENESPSSNDVTLLQWCHHSHGNQAEATRPRDEYRNACETHSHPHYYTLIQTHMARNSQRRLMTAEIHFACGACGHLFTLDSNQRIIEHNGMTHEDWTLMLRYE